MAPTVSAGPWACREEMASIPTIDASDVVDGTIGMVVVRIATVKTDYGTHMIRKSPFPTITTPTGLVVGIMCVL